MVESPIEYDISENIGQHTELVLNNKIFGYDMETEDVIKMLNDSEIEHKFSEELKELIAQCGYNGQNSDEKSALCKMKAFICQKYNMLDEEERVSEKTVIRWLKGECKPDNSPKSRESMFKLMFALGANLELSSCFFLKAYYSQPFNFRNSNECIYYWCLKNHKAWDTVNSMKQKIAEIQENNSDLNSFDGKTIIIGKALDEIETADEAAIYIANNILPDEKYFITAHDMFIQLLDEAQTIAEEVYEDENYEDKSYSITYRCKKRSVDSLLLIIFQGADYANTRKEWNYRIRENFPAKMEFSRCFNGEYSNADILRKSLILLMFFITYAKSDDADIDEFYSNVNWNLEECGFPLLYPANPYDRLFLTSICNGTEEVTIMDRFRSIFDKIE